MEKIVTAEKGCISTRFYSLSTECIKSTSRAEAKPTDFCRASAFLGKLDSLTTAPDPQGRGQQEKPFRKTRVIITFP